MLSKINLSEKQKKELLSIKTKHKSAIVRDRAHAILLRNKGITLENIGQSIFRSQYFVKEAIKRFKNNKLEQIKLTGNNIKLSKQNREKIIEIIKNKTPKDLKDFKFSEEFWTTDILKAIIKKRYKIEYKDKNSYYNLFKQAGFSFHKPKARDYRQDEKKVRDFKGALKKSSKTTRIQLSW